MSYQKFANPKGGYQNSQPTAASVNLITPKPATSIPIYGKEGDFTEKTVYKDGVGNFHINHFIGYFSHKNMTQPNLEFIKDFNTIFFNNFCQIFSPDNVAVASPSKFNYRNKKTVKFEINGNSKFKDTIIEDIKYFSGLIHSDWVSFEKFNDFSFYGSTLKKNWAEKIETELFLDLAKVLNQFNLVTEDNAIRFIRNLIEVNQHHFLAGRRSWAVGYDKSINLFFVETMAFERSSQCEYNVVEKTGKLRETIIELWTRLIFNFFKMFPIHPSNIFKIPENFNLLKTENYDLKSNNNNTAYLMYKSEEDKTATKLLNKPWVQNAIIRHPGLLKDL